MARGWESKSVELQIESSEDHQDDHSDQRNEEEAERMRKKQNLLLSRAWVIKQREASRNPRHQEMLDRALADLESELAELE